VVRVQFSDATFEFGQRSLVSLQQQATTQVRVAQGPEAGWSVGTTVPKREARLKHFAQRVHRLFPRFKRLLETRLVVRRATRERRKEKYYQRWLRDVFKPSHAFSRPCRIGASNCRDNAAH
jgi:hypothetical protein